MTFVRLRAITSFLREADGTTHIQLSQGGALSFGRGWASVLDELGRGIPEPEWSRRVEIDPVVAQIDLTLNEHHLLEQSISLQSTPLIRSMSPQRVGKVAWWSHVAALLLVAVISTILHFQITTTTIDPIIMWWDFLFIPIVIMATLLLHESGHYTVARLCGHKSVIKMWRGGMLSPQCVITPGDHPLSVTHKILILAAGPWSDGLLLLAILAYSVFINADFIVRVAAICALLSLLFNLWPSRRSDFGRMLSLAPSQISGVLVRRICWILLPAMAVITLFGFVSNMLS